MQDPPKGAGSKLVKQLIGIAAAALLLWLALIGTDPEKLFGYMSQVQPLYLVLVFLSGIFSHLLRAWRWLILLAPLAKTRVSLWNSFCAVMIGYAVNVVIPRGGEVARLISIVKSEGLPWAGVLSTMFIDRLLDIALLVLLLGTTFIVFPKSAATNLSWLVPVGFIMSAATLAGLCLLPQAARIIHALTRQQLVAQRLPERLLASVENLAKQFDAGTKSLSNPGALPAIAALSLLIWFFYWLNFYLMVLAFSLGPRVSAAKTLIVFTIGTVGVLVPTPGNVGSFHFLVKQALVKVASLDDNLAMAFATVLHAFCFIIVTCLPAAICVIVQSVISSRSCDSSRSKTGTALEGEHAEMPQP